jgi:lipid-binding SYLF domain-containing protein
MFVHFFELHLALICLLNAVKSFVDGANNGLDGVIPRHVLEHARGFAIFTVFKAGFLFSARAGSGIVIARLNDGCKLPQLLCRVNLTNR